MPYLAEGQRQAGAETGGGGRGIGIIAPAEGRDGITGIYMIKLSNYACWVRWENCE